MHGSMGEINYRSLNMHLRWFLPDLSLSLQRKKVNVRRLVFVPFFLKSSSLICITDGYLTKQYIRR